MSFVTTQIALERFRLTMPPRLDSTQAQAFRTAIQQLLAGSLKQLELDCTGLEYVDSTGLGLLTLARGEAEVIGSTVSLTNIRWPSAVADVLMLVHFDQLFPMTFLDVQGHHPAGPIPVVGR